MRTWKMENYSQDDDEEQYDGDAGPLSGVLLVLPGYVQLLDPTPHVRIGSSHVALDVVQLFAL
ncbi:hypothetical protein CR513_53649, partial [Mucuna pruriens]